MDKLLTYPGYDQYGPHIFSLDDDPNRVIGHVKMAQARSRALPPVIEHYIKTAKPIPGKTQLLIDSMGASPYWGSNVNGDIFTKEALAHEGDDYGYRTFMKYAHVYRNHINKNPERAYGNVKLSAYDPLMHRVLLVVSVDNNRCSDILSDLHDGKYSDVSMGCFRAGTRVTVDGGITKPIEKIEVGDLVLTHRGRYRRVTKTHRRQYSGNMYAVKAAGRPTVYCTHQHPFYAVPESQVRLNANTSSRTCMDGALIHPEWVHTDCLDGEVLLEPVPRRIRTKDPSIEYARLLGYYLADGHTTKNKHKQVNGLDFCVSKSNPITSEIEQICEALKTPNSPTYRSHPRSEKATHVSIYGKDLAQSISNDGGNRALQKQLSPNVLGWSNECFLAMLGAFANGDGCALPGNALRLSTCSRKLADQFRMILHWMEIPAAMATLRHKAGKGFTNERGTIEYAIHIGKLNVARFASWTYKAEQVHPKRIRRDRIYVKGSDEEKFCVSPIREISSLPVEMEVFNFEVEEDESYVAEGLAVHNCRVPFDVCSVCQNRARNRGEYCPHLRYQMNKILPDGRRVGAINTRPKFFDISFVLIGAEKASHVLKKVAYQQRPHEVQGSALEWDRMVKQAGLKTGATNKRATMTKRLPGTATPLDDEKKQIVGQLLDDASQVKGQEEEISTPAQDYLSRFPLKDIFSTLASLGIVLRPEEFQRLVLIKMGHDELAEKLASRRMVFDEYNPGKLPGWASDFGTFEPGAMNEKIALAMRPYMAGRSVYPEILASRLARFDKKANEFTYERDSPWWPMNKEQMRASSGEQGIVPASLALASAYIAYKNILPALLGKGSMASAIKKSWFIPILLGAGVGASVGLSTLAAKRRIGEHEKLSSVDDIDGSKYDTQKTAGPNAALMRLGVPAAIYGYAGIRANQARKGRRLGALDRAIVLNPGWSSLVGFGLTPNILKSIRSLSKHAGIGADLGLYALGSPGRFMPGVLAAGMLDSLIFRGIARLASRKKGKAHG